MTEAQERIWRFIHERFERESVNLMLIGEAKVKVTDKSRRSMTIEMNQYGDIIDTDTGRKIAISDIPHDQRGIGKIPTSWTDLPQ